MPLFNIHGEAITKDVIELNWDYKKLNANEKKAPKRWADQCDRIAKHCKDGKIVKTQRETYTMSGDNNDILQIFFTDQAYFTKYVNETDLPMLFKVSKHVNGLALTLLT